MPSGPGEEVHLEVKTSSRDSILMRGDSGGGDRWGCLRQGGLVERGWEE